MRHSSSSFPMVGKFQTLHVKNRHYHTVLSGYRRKINGEMVFVSGIITIISIRIRSVIPYHSLSLRLLESTVTVEQISKEIYRIVGLPKTDKRTTYRVHITRNDGEEFIHRLVIPHCGERVSRRYEILL